MAELLGRMAVNGHAAHMFPSLSRLAIGAGLGVFLGVLAVGLFSLGHAGLTSLLAALFPIPKIALPPLFVIWFGAFILEAGALYDLEKLFAGVTPLLALGVTLAWAMGRIEARALAWRGDAPS